MGLLQTRVQFWSKEQFSSMGISDPVCDGCSVILKEFPVPVVHHLFDYAIVQFDSLGRRTGGYAMRGGLAMCPKCFSVVMDELEKKGEEIITEYKCGCKTQKIGQTFFIKPCFPDCEICKMVLEESKVRGNKIEFRRDKVK
jgi:hypothetical protein